MHQSKTRAAPNQSKLSNNRAARQRQKRAGKSNDAPPRGITASAGSKGARRRKNGK